MPAGVGLELVVVIGLLGLLLLAFVVGRRLRAAPIPESRKLRREGLGARVRSFVGKDRPTDDDWRSLEEALIRADTGRTAARELVTRVRERHDAGQDPEVLLIEEIAGMFDGDPRWALPFRRLAVVMVVGVNGTGKTTSIGKLAHHLKGEGKKVAVANSDTFRAAAEEQLGVWAERAGADYVSQERGADPGSVAFDAVESATARGHHVLIIDTAGRLHSKKPLMDELAKVGRVIEKAAGRPADEVLLVLDASTGQNGIAQARAFTEAAGVTGVILTKLDGSAKGGIVLAVHEELGTPVRFVGTGETIEDLEVFDPKTYAESLVRS
ncbi:MAG: signal recognition particle-docking protein FtsY [Actinomycetota bacterium]|nr:signal recognition particle-docking protein FtsY [Actinomycetota bacterium]